MKRENAFQASLIDELKETFSGCIVLKNDSSCMRLVPCSCRMRILVCAMIWSLRVLSSATCGRATICSARWVVGLGILLAQCPGMMQNN